MVVCSTKYIDFEIISKFIPPPPEKIEPKGKIVSVYAFVAYMGSRGIAPLIHILETT
jgi:hypothetical protein